MRALLCEAFGPPETLTVQDVADPAPGPGQLLVRVRAAGVNYADTLIIEDKYQVKPPLPFAPGGEIAGEIISVGDGVTDFAPGDSIMALSTYGAFAELCVVEASAAIRVPPSVDLTVAAAIPIAYGTSYHALVGRAALQAGETLLVLGASGGVGLAALDIGKALGATVIAAASSDEKLALCRERGADMVLNYATEEFRPALKALCPKGPNVIYDPVGGDLAEPAFRSIAPMGRHLVIGFAGGGIPKIPLNLTLLKSASLVGVFWGNYVKADPAGNNADMAQLFEWLADGKIAPLISATHSLDEGAAAIRTLSDRKAVGKLVICP